MLLVIYVEASCRANHLDEAIPLAADTRLFAVGLLGKATPSAIVTRDTSDPPLTLPLSPDPVGYLPQRIGTAPVHGWTCLNTDVETYDVGKG